MKELLLKFDNEQETRIKQLQDRIKFTWELDVELDAKKSLICNGLDNSEETKYYQVLKDTISTIRRRSQQSLDYILLEEARKTIVTNGSSRSEK